MSSPVSPDCEQGKHDACSGDAWDHTADAPARCACCAREHRPSLSVVSPTRESPHVVPDGRGAATVANRDRSTAAIARRTQQAVDLHLAGLTYERIAQEVGYSDASGARNAVLRAIREAAAPSRDAARDAAVARCDRMLRAWWPRALQGDKDAARVCLDWEARRARLLGLDAPQRVEVTDEMDQAIRSLEARLSADGAYTVTDA